MGEEFAFGVLKIFVDKLVDPIICQFSYVCFYKSNIENLERGVHKLQDKRDGVKRSVDAAGWNLEVVAPDVTSWMKEVEAAELAANTLLGGTEKVKSRCLYGSCPKLKQRYLLSRKASKQTMSLAKLQEEGNNYAKFSNPALPASMTSSLSPIFVEEFESRISTTKHVLASLMNDQIHIVGLCGLGGVGKTTMVNEVREQARSEKLFDEVVMAVVSQNPDMMNIQDQLAGMMGLKLNDRFSTRDRGEKVRERISQGKRVLVILDDVWGILSYDDLGIPIQGCKIVLTSRSDQVCRSMKAQHIIQVKLLRDEEAWDLFKSKAGDRIESIDIKSTAKKVLKECGGLPLAIVTVGAALNSKEKYAWLDALEQLKTCAATNIEGMEMYVYSSLRLSYDYLQSDQIKRLFLLCCLFQEDSNIQIEHLVRYAAGLSLFRDIQKVDATRRRVKSFIDQLKGCYLVMEADKEGCVKLHDVVRAFGLVVASDVGHAYFVKHDPNMKEWPENDFNEDYKAISLYSEEKLEFPTDLKYPNLELLQLCTGGTAGTWWSLQLSENRFEGMEKLRVAAFMKMFIVSNLETEALQEAATKSFTNVRTLCLEYCNVKCKISLITSLPKLEILSFYNSGITEVPLETAQVNSLKLLDLRGTPMSSFQSGILSNLKKLEELYMGFLLSNPMSKKILEEINSLPSLVLLVIELRESRQLVKMKDVFDRLIRFDISLLSLSLDYVDRGYKSPINNRVVLHDTHIDTLHAANINGLMKNTEELSLRCIDDLRDIVKDLDRNNFVNLKTLYIRECDEFEAELGSEMLPAGSFGKLEEVTLVYLPLFTCFWKGAVRHPRLTNLRVVKVYNCMKLRTLFPVSIAKFLVQLEEIIIQSCHKLKEVFYNEADQHKENDSTITVLPKMKYLCLNDLPRFASFLSFSDNTYSQDEVERPLLHQATLPSLEKLVFILNHKKSVVGGLVQSEISKLRFLKIGSCSDVQIVRPDLFQMLHNLEKMNVDSCHLLESMFDLNGIKAEAMILGKLGSLKLEQLPSLNHVWTKIPRGFQGFQNLRILKIVRCDNLRYVLSSSMARILVNLELIRIDRCDQMEVIIQEEVITEEIDHILLPRLDKLEMSRCNKMSDLTLALLGEKHTSLKIKKSFQKLKSVTIFNCNNLKNLLSPSLANSLVYLQHIDVRFCGSLVEVMRGDDKYEKLNKILFPQMQSLRLESLDKLEVFFPGSLDTEFPCLDDLSIQRCPEMRSFCSGLLIAPKVNLVNCQAGASEWNGDLNSTMQHIYQLAR